MIALSQRRAKKLLDELFTYPLEFYLSQTDIHKLLKLFVIIDKSIKSDTKFLLSLNMQSYIEAAYKIVTKRGVHASKT